MKKKVKQKMSLIGIMLISYFGLFMLNNSKFIILKFFGKLDNSLCFLNLVMAISLITILMLYLFKIKIREYDNLLTFVIVHIVFYNFISGIIPTFCSEGFLLLEMYLLFITYIAMITIKKEFSISLITAFTLLLISSFVFGMLNILWLVKYLLILSVILGIFIIIKKKQEKSSELKDSLKKIFCYQSLVFCIFFFIAIIGGVGRYVHSWDEYSHWAYDAKATILNSKIDAYLGTSTYPPVLTIWYYVVSIFTGFTEPYLYISISIFIITYLMPAFLWVSKREKIFKLLGFALIPFCCTFFGGVYSYTSLYADYAITAIFSATIILYYFYEDTKEKNYISLILLLIIMTLMKPNGFVISFVALCIMFFNEIFNYEYEDKIIIRILKNVWDFIKKRWKCILAVALTFIIWNLYTRITNLYIEGKYNYVLLPDSLKSDLSLKLNKDFIINFINSIFASFDEKIIDCFVSISLWKYLLIVFSVLFFCFYFENKKNVKKAILKLLPFVISYVIFFVLTVLSMFWAMSYYEASQLASFGRYLDWFHLGLLIFIIAYLSKNSFHKSRNINLVILIGYLFLIINIPFSQITYFITDYSVRKQTEIGKDEFVEKFQILNEKTPKTSKIFIIDQKDKDGIMAMWYARYYAYPRTINASSSAIVWKIKTEKNKDDLGKWGLTGKKLEKHLIDYDFDYVYLYTSDDELFSEIKWMFDSVDKAKKCKLFKIKKINKNQIKLIPIK